jgi:hypothetical protein
VTKDIAQAVGPEYWLTVCNGAATARALTAGDVQEALRQVVGDIKNHPLVILPEFPDALLALAHQQRELGAARAYASAAGALRRFQTRHRDLDPETDAFIRMLCAAELGETEAGNRLTNLRRAVRLMADAAKPLAPFSKNLPGCLMVEGNARLALALLGDSPVLNLQEAVTLFAKARNALAPDHASVTSLLANEAYARHALADRKVNARENLESALVLYQHAFANVVESRPPDFDEAKRLQSLFLGAQNALADLQ